MNAPVEVVLVNRKEANPWPALVGKLLGIGLAALLAGFWLMLLLPLAAEVLGTPDLHPDYWRCVALVALARGLFHGVTAIPRPLARVSS